MQRWGPQVCLVCLVCFVLQILCHKFNFFSFFFLKHILLKGYHCKVYMYAMYTHDYVHSTVVYKPGQCFPGRCLTHFSHPFFQLLTTAKIQYFNNSDILLFQCNTNTVLHQRLDYMSRKIMTYRIYKELKNYHLI